MTRTLADKKGHRFDGWPRGRPSSPLGSASRHILHRRRHLQAFGHRIDWAALLYSLVLLGCFVAVCTFITLLVMAALQ